VDEDSGANLSRRALQQVGQYADAFLEAAYEVLMNTLRRDLEPGIGVSRLQRADFLRFFRMGAFFTRYVHLKQVTLCWQHTT
jgi:hypothetical protein